MNSEYANFPPELKKFVREGYPEPDSRKYKKQMGLLLSAKQLRKKYFRDMQIVEPGSQYYYTDYERRMRVEITSHVKRVLSPKLLADWETCLDECNRLAKQWNHLFDVNRHRIELSTKNKSKRIILELKRQCIREGSLDPRTLGEIELFVHGRMFYGMPSGHNQT